MWEVLKHLKTTFLIDGWFSILVEKLTLIKGLWEMFTFFSDIKNRLVALEAKVEALFKDKTPPTTETVVPDEPKQGL